MSHARFPLLHWTCLAIATVSGAIEVDAAVVFLKNGGPPIAGFLVSQSDHRVTLRRILPSGYEKEESFNREQIAKLVVSVSDERLAELSPESPADYRDYAEELVEKQLDPEAIETGLHLYLIAAYLDTGRIRESALRGMIANARTSDEERRFRALAFVTTQFDRSFLKSVDAARRSTAISTPRSKANLLQSIRAARQGEFVIALQLAETDEVKGEFEAYASTLSHAAFVKLCLDEKFDEAELGKMLAIELSLFGDRTGKGSFDKGSMNQSESWGQIIATRQTTPIANVTFETITEFDPRECLYREGTWQLP